jgi:hypothetical protein
MLVLAKFAKDKPAVLGATIVPLIATCHPAPSWHPTRLTFSTREFAAAPEAAEGRTRSAPTTSVAIFSRA